MSQLYSDMKVFHFPTKLQSLERAAPLTGPLHLRIKPTNICNHRCYYCCFRTEETGPMGQNMVEKDCLPLQKILEILDDFSAMGGKAITFSGGGEPFAYPHLLAAVRRAAEHGIHFASLTNGALLRGEVADFFARQGSWVRVSMDGWDDASYTHYRGVSSGEYQKILHNMEAFVSKGGPCALSVSFNIDQDNYLHIADVLRDLKSRGVRSVQLTSCIVSVDAEKQRKYQSRFYDDAQCIIVEAMHTLSCDSFEIKDNYSHVNMQYDNAFSWCPYQQVLSVIGADAQVYTCQHKAYNPQGLLGSLREQRFKTFWEDGKEKFYRIVPARDCGHFCVAHQKNKLLLDYLAVNTQHQNFV